MNAERAHELADEIAYWLFDQSNEIISDPETFSEALEAFLLTIDA